MSALTTKVQNASLYTGAVLLTTFWNVAGALGAPPNFGPIPSETGGPDPGSNPTATIRATVLRVLAVVLNYLALVAVIFIVVAGIRLIVSQGDDTAKDKAKKTILYVAIGLIVILVARVLVQFISTIFQQ